MFALCVLAEEGSRRRRRSRSRDRVRRSRSRDRKRRRSRSKERSKRSRSRERRDRGNKGGAGGEEVVEAPTPAEGEDFPNGNVGLMEGVPVKEESQDLMEYPAEDGYPSEDFPKADDQQSDAMRYPEGTEDNGEADNTNEYGSVAAQ